MSQSVANKVFDEMRRGGATRRELLAAGVTGIHESGFRNLNYGDRDSEGWRQERKMYYSNPTNVRAAARRFLNEAKEFRGKPMSIGQLAQAVQQSGDSQGFEGLTPQAKKLLRIWGGAGGGGGGGADGGGRTVTTPAKTEFDMKGATVEALLQHRNPLQAIAAARTSGRFDVTTPAKTTHLPARDGGSRGGGSVKVSPSANRAGVGISRTTMSFVETVAGEFGSTLTIGTGTRHSRMTTSGNVSDHWDGHGADIPAAGKRLTRMGQAALIAAGMSPAKARKQRGGAYTLTRGGKRIQIIFNSNVGGNHYDHLHVGVR